MKIIVQKFGGTSVASEEAALQLKQGTAGYPQRLLPGSRSFSVWDARRSLRNRYSYRRTEGR